MKFGGKTPAALVLTALGLPILPILAACPLDRRNPYDEYSPSEYQAAAQIQGKIQAVMEPYEEDGSGGLKEPEAASCPEFEADHSGFEVVLRGLGTTSNNSAVRVQSQFTDETGRFAFVNIEPGEYTVEFLRPGYEAPPPLTVPLVPGEVLQLPTRCAINRTPPERPQVEPIPAATVADSIEVVILECDPVARPNERFTINRHQSDGSEPLTVTLPDAGGNCSSTISLLPEQQTAARTLWQLEVVARDALDNTSEPLQLEVIRDTQPPEVPTELKARLGRTHLELSWHQPTPTLGDDTPLRWFVSYSLVERPDSLVTPECPYGVYLEDDTFESARFAEQGPSPLTAETLTQLLTGMQPGTDIYLQVAAQDQVGNVSCWSQPLYARPDIVTAAFRDSGASVPDSGRSSRFAGVTAYALNSGGMEIVGSNSSEVVALPTTDVTAGRYTFFGAGGVQGVHVVEFEPDGTVLSSSSRDVGANVKSLVSRPGVLVLGTDSGVQLLRSDDFASRTSPHDPGNLSAPTEQILSWGRTLLLVRAAQPYHIQLARRDNPSHLLGSMTGYAVAPDDIKIINRNIWLALGQRGVQPVDIDSCLAVLDTPSSVSAESGAQGCLQPQLAIALPMDAQAKAIAAFDDLIAVAAQSAGGQVNTAGIYFLRASTSGPPQWVGRLSLPEDAEVLALQTARPGLCVTYRSGTDTVRRCLDDTGDDLVRDSSRLYWGSPVYEVHQSKAEAWIREGGGVDALSFEPAIRQVPLGQEATRVRYAIPADDYVVTSGSSTIEHYPLGAPRFQGSDLVADIGLFTLDFYGRLWFADVSHTGDNAAQLVRVDDGLAATLAAQMPQLVRTAMGQNVTYITAGLVTTMGHDLLITLQNNSSDTSGCHETKLARLQLQERLGDGKPTLGAVDIVDLEQSIQIFKARMDGAQALISAVPFGVYEVSIGQSLAVPANGGLAIDCASASATTYVTSVITSPTTAERFISGTRDDNGTEVNGIFLWQQQNLNPVAIRVPSAAQTIASYGSRLFVGTVFDGAFLYDLPSAADISHPSYPRLAFPELRTPVWVVTTARGMLIPNLLFGATWVVVQ